jgi:hypothetical protein
MSEFSLPPLSVSHDSRWVLIPLHGDIGEWVQKATADYVAKRGGNKKQVRGLLEGSAKVARRADDAAMALILMPVAAEGIRALARFCPVNMSRLGEDDDRWSALLGNIVPNSQWGESAEITEMTTKAGPCRRIIYRYAEGEGDTRTVGEHVGYAWLFPQYAAGIIMMTSFLNLAEAARWRSTLDELAAGVELEPAS